MTARALEELDRGLGSCLANECSELAGTGTGQVKEDEARGTLSPLQFALSPVIWPFSALAQPSKAWLG